MDVLKTVLQNTNETLMFYLFSNFCPNTIASDGFVAFRSQGYCILFFCAVDAESSIGLVWSVLQVQVILVQDVRELYDARRFPKVHHHKVDKSTETS